MATTKRPAKVNDLPPAPNITVQATKNVRYVVNVPRELNEPGYDIEAWIIRSSMDAQGDEDEITDIAGSLTVILTDNNWITQVFHPRVARAIGGALIDIANMIEEEARGISR